MEAVILIVSSALFWIAIWISRSAWFKGKVGERQVSVTLRRKLDQRDYYLIDDLVLPTSDGGSTQIDHVVISRFGIFVIETKNMSGWIFGNERSAEWTQVIYSWKSQFQNPLRQNYKHVKTVQRIVGLEAHQLHSLVAFVGTAEPRTEMPGNVVWGKKVLPYLIKTYLREVIGQQELDHLQAQLLNSELDRNSATRWQHRRKAKDLSEGNPSQKNHCLRCGARMVVRTNRKTGDNFWGCSDFPRCKNSRPTL